MSQKPSLERMAQVGRSRRLSDRDSLGFECRRERVNLGSFGLVTVIRYAVASGYSLTLALYPYKYTPYTYWRLG
jgi:hypothetical protein